MTAPFTQYLAAKDNYCLLYLGEDKSLLDKVIVARDYIERALPGMRLYVGCRDDFKAAVHGKRNIILQSRMGDYSGKMAHSYELEKKEDLKALLEQSKITIPEDF